MPLQTNPFGSLSRFKCTSLLLLAAVGVLWTTNAGPVHAARSTPAITITIDDTVITRLLALIQARDDSAASIDAWIDLPGNKELLDVGAAEHQLTRAQLHENVKAAIDGTATETDQPRYAFGRVLISPVDDYRGMIAELHKRAHDWLTECANRDAAFTPPGVIVRQTVYLHLGGDWDAINRDGAIYINMAFFHDYFKPAWFGLNLLIAHETFHAVQNAAFGNPESVANADAAFYTALSKTQREGMARFVEVETDPNGYAAGTYGFYFRGVDEESLREFPQTLALLGSLTGACYPRFDADRYEDDYGTGMNAGGPLYTLGEGIATAINRYDGQQRLIQTVSNGPLDFFDCYIQLVQIHPDLPAIPDAARRQIERLRALYPNGRVSGVANEPISGPPIPSNMSGR